tara:strand:+ start:261 stop:1406 length:1146 start_codon:yes stop_codon:yes gene_type:complete
MRIPWASPLVGDEELAETVDAVRSGWLSMGKRVRTLEERMAEIVGRKHGVAVSNGTVALDLALKALRIAPDDEVIVPAMTYIATVNAVLYQGATPIFADLEPHTFNVDPMDVRQKITPRTRAVLVIDYGGNPCDHAALEEICAEHGLLLILDGAQSLGGSFRGKPLCQFGTISTASFHIAKTITTVEGGIIFTDDAGTADKLRILRNQGEDPNHKYQHIMLGYNARLSDLHAAIGLGQMAKLEGIWKRRGETAEQYREALQDVEGIRIPKTRDTCFSDCRRSSGCCQNAWFLYPILVDRRDDVAAVLRKKGVDTRICYPMPIYRQPFVSRLFPRSPEDDCPVAEDLTRRVLNLPMYYDLSTAEVRYVADELEHALYETRVV